MEPPRSVRKRVLSLIVELENREPDDSQIFLVIHGDTLQILETALQGWRPEYHRALKPLETAEIRKYGRQYTS